MRTETLDRVGSFLLLSAAVLSVSDLYSWVGIHTFLPRMWYTLGPNHRVSTHTTDTRVLVSLPNHAVFLFLVPITSEPQAPPLLSLPFPYLSDWISLSNPG